MSPSHDAEQWAHRLGAFLVARKSTIAVAESLTAGLVTGCIASVPGASAYLLGGATTYSNGAKASVLGVAERTLSVCGAVSEATALEMATGTAALYGADVGLSTTGVAGPGLQEGKPAGTVCLGVWVLGALSSCQVMVPGGERNEIRHSSVYFALRYLVAVLDGERVPGRRGCRLAAEGRDGRGPE